MDGPHKHRKRNVCLCAVNICSASQAVGPAFEDVCVCFLLGAIKECEWSFSGLNTFGDPSAATLTPHKTHGAQPQRETVFKQE